MASITVRNLDERVKQKLRVRAAANGKSMEQEVRDILRIAVEDERQPTGDLASALRARFAPLGGVEFDIPRDAMREPPQFG